MLKLGVAARKDISLPGLSALTECSSRPATPAAELEALDPIIEERRARTAL